MKVKIGKTIRRLRKERKISGLKLYRMTGLAPATLSRMEHDKMVGHLHSHILIAKALGLKLSQYFAEAEKDGAI